MLERNQVGMHKNSAGPKLIVCLIALMSLASGGCGKDTASTESNGGPLDRGDTSVGDGDPNRGDGDGDDHPPFTFDRAAVLGDGRRPLA